MDRIYPVHHVDANDFHQVITGDIRCSLLYEVGPPDEYQCALSDAQVMERLRKRISKLDGSVLSAIGITRKLLHQYVDTIEGAGLGGDEALKESAYEDAAETLIEGLEQEVESTRDLVKELMAYPLVEQLLSEAEVSDKLGGVSPELLNSSTEEDAEELASLQHRIEEARGELLTLQERIKAKTDEFHQTRKNNQEREVMAPYSSSISTSAVSKVEPISDVDGLKETVTAWCMAGGLDPYTVQSALAAVLANPMTAICGARAEAMGTALASTLAGDHAVRVSVGSAVFGLSDLMCEPITPIGHTSLNGAALLGDYLAAQPDDAVVVVLLSGFNRVPPEVVLPDLLPDLAGERRLAWTHRNGGVGSCTLSDRVRIIATLIGGATTHRIPYELSSCFALVPADYQPLGRPAIATSRSAMPARIDPKLLDELQHSNTTGDIKEQAEWLNERLLALSPAFTTQILSTYFHFLDDSKRAPAEALAALLSGRPWRADTSDLPGVEAPWIRQHLESLNEQPAWQAARRHFDIGVEP
ncbi:hypothetical protein EQG41_06740 [Billgrantia azerbaijanica]|nr:hypothetical protein EQG41_06740 [Halomonas azerbaijanica]